MKIDIQLTIFLFMASTVLSNDNPYCELDTCPDGTHTLCQFSDLSKYGEKCENVNPDAVLSVPEIYNILKFHKILRRSIVSHPEALEWDEELALIAQRWANQCENAVDRCRNVVRFNVTQRVDVQVSPTNLSKPLPFSAIQRWYNEDNIEILNFQHLRLGDTNSNGYSAIPLLTANRLGCGLVRTLDYLQQQLYFVCNYAYLDVSHMEAEDQNF